MSYGAQWPVAPAQAIVDAGVALEMELEANGDIYPGDVVEFDTAECPRIVAGSDDTDGIIGVADISMGSYTGRGAKRDVCYEEGDQVKLVSGDMLVMLRLANSVAITCGDHLQPAPSGEVKKYVCGTDNVCQLLAQAFESKASVTVGFQWILAKWLKGG